MKKTLAAFLAVLMMFGMVPVGAVDTGTTAVVTESDDMRFATSLGIMDDTYEASATITRLELAKCYYNVIMNGADITGFANSIFTDAAGEASDIVMTCCNRGIMTGTSATTFSPNDPVTYQQLMKTMVVFLGYDSRAVAEGGWPYGYLAVASSLGICKNVAMDAEVTVEQVAKVFRDSIDISIMQRTSFGSDGYETKYGDNWLRLYRNVERVRGTVEANHMTDLGGRNPRDYARVTVGGTDYLLNGDTLDLKNQIGYKVDIFVDVTENIGTILHWEYMDADTVLIDGTDVAGYANGRISYYAENGKTNIKLAEYARVVYNGSYCASYDEDVINPFANSTLEGSITAIDNDSDGEFEYVEIDAYDTYVVSAVVDKKIFTKYRNDVVIDTEKLDEDHIMVTNVMGDEMWLRNIKIGDILSVSRDVDGNIKRVVATVDNFKGIVSEISGDENGAYVIGIDENTYECSKSLVLNKQFMDELGNMLLEAGDTVRLFFNKDGKVSDIEREEFIQHSIGYLVNAAPVKGGMDANWEVKIFTSGNSMEIYKLAEKVEVDGYGTLKAANAIALAYEMNADGENTDVVKRQVIQYDSDDKTDEIIYIDYCDSTTPSDGLYEYNKDNWYGLYYRDGTGNFSGQLMVDSNTTVFDVPSEAERDDDELYYIGSFPRVSNTEYMDKGYADMRAYGTNKRSKLATAMVLMRTEGDPGHAIAHDIRMFTVDKITETVNADGDTVYKVVGVINGASMTYYAEDGVLNMIALDGKMPQKGDILCLSADSENYIKSASFIFDESTRMFGTPSVGTANPEPGVYSGGNPRYVYGKVTYADSGCIDVDVVTDGATWSEIHKAASYRITTYKKNADEGDNAATVSAGSTDDIYDEYHYPSIGSYVVLQMQNWTPLSMTVYND